MWTQPIRTKYCRLVGIADAVVSRASTPITLAGVVLLLMACLPGFAISRDRQLIQCRIDRWGSSNGLNSTSINTITQTPDGYIWLGTDAGLVRFDGVAFKYYTQPDAPSNITVLKTTRDGTLWYGTSGAGFGNVVGKRFARVDPIGNEWSLTNSITETATGDVWIGGQGQFLAYRWSHGKCTPLWRYQESLPGDIWSVRDIVEDSSHNLWCATPAEGLMVRHPDGTVHIYHIPAWGNVTFPDHVCLDRSGAVWIATLGEGLLRFANGKFSRYTLRDGLPSNQIICLLIDSNGTLWMGTDRGICRYSDGTFTPLSLTDTYGDGEVSSMYEDREGNLWAGVGGELLRFADTKLEPIILQTNQITDLVYQIAPSHHNGVWIAGSNGLHFYSNHRIVDYGAPYPAPRNAVSLVHESPDGSVYALADWKDLFQLVGQKWIPAPHVELTNLADQMLLDDGHQAVAMAGHQLHRIGDGSLFAPDANAKVGYLYCSCVTPDGSVWLGGEHGLLQIKDGKSTLYDHGLVGNHHILALASDHDRLWVGTDSGLGYFKDGCFTIYGPSDGLPAKTVLEILVANDGSIWAGGMAGIYRISADDLAHHKANPGSPFHPVAFGNNDGVRSYPAGPTHWSEAKTQDGTLFFQGEHGITVVTPESMLFNQLPPPVHIDQFLADGVDMPTQGTISVPPGRRSLEFHYTGLSYRAPDRVLFRYQLVGFDRRWIEAGTRRAAYYTNLPPGTYIFRVTACNEDGVWNPTGVHEAITLEPYFYETPLFGVSVFALFMAAIVLAFLSRIRMMQQRTVELERKVVERTEQLAQQNEQLQQAQAEVLAQNDQLHAVQSELEAQNEELTAARESLSEANAQLEELATTDGLTGLFNRRAFLEALDREWNLAVRYGEPLSVIMLDVDKFKQYNDTYGHPAGDEVLKQVSNLLSETGRMSDVVARYGGEEFIVVLPRTSRSEAVAVAERIRETVERHTWTRRAITASLGVATIATTMEHADQLIGSADEALYKAKKQGRNLVCTSFGAPDSKMIKSGPSA